MRENNPWSPPAWLGEPSGTPQQPEEPFTLPAQEIPRELWKPYVKEAPAPKRTKPPRSLAFALPFVIVLGLLSAFFSWVSAEPLWLAVGHGTSGTATVTRCVGEGTTRRCLGDFTADADEFAVTRVSLLGITDATPGKPIKAQMVSERSQRAYAGGGFVLRWLPGLILVMLCGLAIALVTGVSRMADRRDRWAAFGVSMAGPILVTVGFLAASF